MIQARTGGASRLPEGSRWLDLFAGTGSIGLEVRFEMYVHDFKIPLSMVLYRGAAAGWSSCRSVGQGARPDMIPPPPPPHLQIAELLAHEHFGTSAAVPAAPLVTSTRAAVQVGRYEDITDTPA